MEILVTYGKCKFGFAHFSYIFLPYEGASPIFYPFWWGFNGAVIGITSAYFYISKKQIWPLIFAHWTNNVISAIILRRNIDGVPFWQDTFLIIYVPIFVFSIVFWVIYRKSLIFHIKRIYNFFKDYIIETPKKGFLALDFALIIVLWLMTLF